MSNKQHINLVTGYLQGSLSETEQQQLIKLIDSGEISLLDLKELDTLYKQIDTGGIPQPSDSLGKRFYRMLEQEKRNHRLSLLDLLQNGFNLLRIRIHLKKLAFMVPVFLLGLYLGSLFTPFGNQEKKIARLSTEVTQLREMMMINLLDDASPIERLKAVNISSEIQPVDNRIIKALLTTLNNDTNVNVRVAAVEALVRHAQKPHVRQGLVNSITRQESPIVQSALADAMLSMQENQSVEEFKILLKRDELDGNVRSKLENTIAALN